MESIPFARSLAVAAALLSVAPASAQQVEHVFIVVMDGVRSSEAMDDTDARFVGPLVDELAPQGSLFTTVENRGVTITLPAHQVFVTGTWGDHDTVPAYEGRQYLSSRHPTLFELYRHQTGAAADSCWVVANSGQVIDCHHSVAPGYGPEMGAQLRAHLTALPDNWVWEQLEEIMAVREVNLVLLNLHESDRMGHAGNWPGYTGAVAHAAEAIADFWEELQDDPVYADSTALFVTTDHGRHFDSVSTGWHDHNCSCNGCRKSFLLMLGPGIREGLRTDDPVSLLDVAPTVGSLMGVSMPHARGRVLTEALEAGVQQPGGQFAPVMMREDDRAIRAWEEQDPTLTDSEGSQHVVVQVSHDGGQTWTDTDFPSGGALQYSPEVWTNGEDLAVGTLEFMPRAEKWHLRIRTFAQGDVGWRSSLDEPLEKAATPLSNIVLDEFTDELHLMENNPQARSLRFWTSDDDGLTWKRQTGHLYDVRRFPRDAALVHTGSGHYIVVFSANVNDFEDTENPSENTEIYWLKSTQGGFQSRDWAVTSHITPSIQPVADTSADARIHLVWADMESGSYQVHHAISRNGGKAFSEPTVLSSAAVGAWEPALLPEGERVWIAWSQLEAVDRAQIHLVAVEEGQITEHRVFGDEDHLARTPALLDTSDGRALLCWSEYDFVSPWKIVCDEHAIGRYPLESASGAMTPGKVRANQGKQSFSFAIDAMAGDEHLGFDRIRIDPPEGFRPTSKALLSADGSPVTGTTEVVDTTLWFHLDELIRRDSVHLDLDVMAITPEEKVDPGEFVVTLQYEFDPYGVEVAGDFAVTTAPGTCSCELWTRPRPGGMAVLALAVFVVLRRRKRGRSQETG
jgi:hypothetical protein